MRNFQTLFKGREDAHGHYFSIKGARATDRGKLASKAESLNEPVTPELFQKHLAGEDRLGIIPVRKDGRVHWLVIDVDFYRIGKKTLAQVGGYLKIANAILGTKLVATKSKSGGVHLWAFLEEPIKASEANEAARNMLAKLDLASGLEIDPEEFAKHVDIFPKDFSPDNIGSWVNLPYFGEECHCIGADGAQDLPLQQFVEYANDRLYHPDELKFKVSKQTVTKKTSSKDIPPCIEFMLREGVPEGHRNDAVTQFAIYALKAHPDDFEEKVREFNEAACQPPMRNDEIAPILKSVQAKGYEGYLCNKIKDIFCDKEACKKRTFGVGHSGEVADVGITSLEKIDGEDPLYIVTIGGKNFTVQVSDLFLYANFRRKALAATNRLLPSLRQPEWEDCLAAQLELMEITEAAADTQMRDRVIKQFQHWCSQCCVTDSLEAAQEAGAPFFDGGNIIFSGDALLSQLDRQLRVDRDEAYVYLRNWGTTLVERELKGKKIKLWCYVPRGPLWFDPMKGRQA